jgi:hypothetical protein
VIGGCLKFSVAFVIAAILGFGVVLFAIVLLGQCAGPPTPEQQLWTPS